MPLPHLRLPFKICIVMLAAANATACTMSMEAATPPRTRACVLPPAPQEVLLRNRQGLPTRVLEPEQTIEVFEESESINSPEGKLMKIRVNGYIPESVYKMICPS
jgi:hypothetical protein